MNMKVKTLKVKLPFAYSATATVCPHCGNEHVTYVIHRDIDGRVGEVWPQVGGYCYMCGKNTEDLSFG